MKTTGFLGVVVVLFVVLVASVAASSPSTAGWSLPIIAGQGALWHPQLAAANDGSFLVSFDKLPQLRVSRSADGREWVNAGTWEVRGRKFFGHRLVSWGQDGYRAVAVSEEKDVLAAQLYLVGESTGPRPIPNTRGAISFGITLEGETLHLAWRNSRGLLFYSRGERGNWEWSQPVQVTFTPRPGTAPVLWARGQQVVVVADDAGTDRTTVFTSVDGGMFWRETLVGSGLMPALVETGKKLVVLVVDGDSNSLVSYVSEDGGNWSSVVVASLAATNFPPTGPFLVARHADGYLLAVWMDERRVYMSLSADGFSWSSPETVYAGEGDNVNPTAVLTESKALVAWLNLAADGERLLVVQRKAPPLGRQEVVPPTPLGYVGHKSR